ncbi:MAG: chemotaxis protein CheR [Desulfuromonadales bacterium]|nr:MAG: chemotaxis protein CheR [Desulfuromonadales bacterium]
MHSPCPPHTADARTLPRTFSHTHPVTDEAETQRHLDGIFTGGPIVDKDINRRVELLHMQFSTYAATVPFGLWGPGLAISPEMRGMTEALLPLHGIRRAFRRLLSRTLHLPFSFDGTPLQTSASWLDCLERLDSPFQEVNPSRLLARLAADGNLRQQFLFSLLVPRRHGASFDRYPGQSAFLQRWLKEQQFSRPLRCLDAACGAGEGTYGLARLLLNAGFAPQSFCIRGTSREPLEIFTAVHGCFPHDPPRQETCRRFRAELGTAGALDAISFAVEDLTDAGTGKRYDIIICNGILGGPFVNRREALRRVVAELAHRLSPGGMLLAADRFHHGWKRLAPPELHAEILAEAGLSVMPAGEGLAGIKSG